MSRRTVLVAVWLAGTVLATSLAFGAVSLVLAGVSGDRAEHLRFGNTVILQPASIERPAAPTTTTPGRGGRPSTTTGVAAGRSPSAGDPSVGVAPTTAAPATPPLSADPNGGPSGAATADPTSGRSGHGGSSSDDGPAPVPSAPSGAPPVSTTYSTGGGTLTASCTGSTIRSSSFPIVARSSGVRARPGRGAESWARWRASAAPFSCMSGRRSRHAAATD